MKLVLLSLALFGCALAEDGRPQGALLVLPQRFTPVRAQQEEALDKVSERLMERLRQEQGSQTGNYHLYLDDGRLQRVQYTAAPLRASPSASSNTYQQNTQQYNQYTQSEQQAGYNPSQTYSRASSQDVSEPNPVVAHFGRLQHERLQQQLAQLQQQQKQLRQQSEQVQQHLQQQKEFASNYVATVQFSDVPPIPAPIYSNSPAPLTRIIRYAPQYF